MPRLVVYISAHGFGHLAQTGPVLNALDQRLPDLQLTVVSGLPEANLRQRITCNFELQARSLDFGFAMEDAFRIDKVASARRYREFHATWDARVSEEAHWLGALKPDLVLANVAYLPLAAAALSAIPAVGLCSLNWADLFDFVFGDEDWAAPIHHQMLSAYTGATAFLKLAPGMRMDALTNSRWIGTVARMGRKRGAQLRSRLELPADTHISLVALGGVDNPLPVEHWPKHPRRHWLVSQAWGVKRSDMTAIEAIGWDFIDLLASVDGAVGKPGYGMFAETACNGIPMLYARRPDWPEQDALIPWLVENARCLEISEKQMQTGDLDEALAALSNQRRPPAPLPAGAAQAARIIAHYLGAAR